VPSQKLKKNLLVIDDDKTLCLLVKDNFTTENLKIVVAHNLKDGLACCSKSRIDIVLLDQKLPDGQGHSICPQILDYNDQTKIIFITAFPSFQHALKAIKGGAHDYLAKPFELEELHMAINKSLMNLDLEKIKQLHGYHAEKEKEENVVVGKFGNQVDIHYLITQAAGSNAPVLITGETGTGKNVVAKAIHFKGKNADAPFFSINCASLSETMIEAELFGYEKGAFTGAVSARKGVFELAENGTLFLDEIGAMPAHLQSKLLGVLDDGKIKRIGGQSILEVNPRIIAATNIDLEKNLNQGIFRKDLYYRLAVIRIEIPLLRERKDDIPELCHFFIKSTTDGKNRTLSESEIRKLKNYHWPGNIRELKNVIERSLILHGDNLKPSELISLTEKPSQPLKLSNPVGKTELKRLEVIEKDYIQKILQTFNHNYTRSAKTLGISLSTLKRKQKKFGL